MIRESTRDGAGPTTTQAVAYVVVCRGPNCRERGSLPLRKRLVELLRGEPTVRLLGYACFGQCDFGPNVALYPEGAWYGGLRADGAAERVARHALGIQPLDATPLRLPEPERCQHLRNIAELVSLVERDSLRARRWWWPF
ncbi:MAG: (2Fe-2S) ferredoxin domain-containing protein [Chloroflexota bacterium]|nr:(2Fe-2S) ferredoxin domain-containing protein [Chloroflexota bacterium]